MKSYPSIIALLFFKVAFQEITTSDAYSITVPFTNTHAELCVGRTSRFRMAQESRIVCRLQAFKTDTKDDKTEEFEEDDDDEEEEPTASQGTAATVTTTKKKSPAKAKPTAKFSKSKWKKKRYLMMQDVMKLIEKGDDKAPKKAEEIIARMRKLSQVHKDPDLRPNEQVYNVCFCSIYMTWTLLLFSIRVYFRFTHYYATRSFFLFSL